MGYFKQVAWQVLLLGFMAACGTSAALPKKAGNSAVLSPFYAVQFDPAEGATLPASVIVSFNKAELNYASLAAITHYNLVCGGITHSASSVNVVTGYSSVTVNLPIINGLASGSTCTLWLSSSLQDADGNALGDTRTVAYRVP